MKPEMLIQFGWSEEDEKQWIQYRDLTAGPHIPDCHSNWGHAAHLIDCENRRHFDKLCDRKEAALEEASAEKKREIAKLDAEIERL